MIILREGIRYFLLVFTAGFLLALVRIPVLEPALGARWAELLEMPLMLVIIWWAAGRCARALPSHASALACGALAVCLMLLVEFTVVLALRNMTIESYLASRDPVAAVAYAVSLVLFALMPALRLKRA